MSQGYSPIQVAELIDRTGAAVRNWSTVYAEFLSPLANPGKGASRFYSDQDTRILLFISQMKHRGLRDDDVRSQLASAQARDWVDLPDLPDVTPLAAAVPMVPAAASMAALDAERRAYMRDLGRMEEQLNHMTQRNDALQDEMNKLQREIGRLEVELEFWREGRLRKE